MARKICFGLVGLGARAYAWLVHTKNNPDIEVVAGADISEAARTRTRETAPHLAYYASLEEMLHHDLDAVLLTTPIFAHAPEAIQCLRAGKHVLSEVTACGTMAEAVALYEAARHSRCMYMLAENYCYLYALQEMRRLYRQNAIGELLFADVYYIADYREWWKPYCTRLWDWRNWMPQSYYTTHALGPVLWMTGLRPVGVTGFAVPNGQLSRSIGKLSDEVASFVVELENGATVNVTSCFMAPAGTQHWWHLVGQKGDMENDRSWTTDRGKTISLLNANGRQTYATDAPHSKELAAQTGHGGADFFVIHDFARAVRGEASASIGIDLAIAMTVPGILAHRSALQGNARIEVPDFRDASARDRYRHDNASPYPIVGNPNPVPPSVLGVSHLDPAFYSDSTKEDVELIARAFGTGHSLSQRNGA